MSQVVTHPKVVTHDLSPVLPFRERGYRGDGQGLLTFMSTSPSTLYENLQNVLPSNSLFLSDASSPEPLTHERLPETYSLEGNERVLCKRGEEGVGVVKGPVTRRGDGEDDWTRREVGNGRE